MSYDIFKCYGLDKIHDSMTEDYDYKDTSLWELVDKKSVPDSDGFMTEYAWYTDGTKHIFMFGDTDIYEPDEDYADYVAESESEAKGWFEHYHGFEDEDDAWEDFEEDTGVEDDFEGNANFMNEGFERVYSEGKRLED